MFPSRTILRHLNPNRTGALLRPENRGEKVAVTCVSPSLLVALVSQC